MIRNVICIVYNRQVNARIALFQYPSSSFRNQICSHKNCEASIQQFRSPSFNDQFQTHQLQTFSFNQHSFTISISKQYYGDCLDLLTKMLAKLSVEITLLTCEYPEPKDLEQLAWTNKRMMQIIKKYLPIAFAREVLFYRKKIY